MKRKILVLLIVQALVIVALFWALVFYGKDEYEAGTRAGGAPAPAQRTSVEDGATVVELSLETQRQSGIETAALAELEFRPQRAAFGAVLGIEALLDLRSRYLAARADAEAARAALGHAQRDAERLGALNRDDHNVSDRAAQAAEAQAAGAGARLAAAEALAASLRGALRQQWPATLADWASAAPAPAALQALLERREVLLSVSLPEALAGTLEKALEKALDKAQAKAQAKAGKGTRIDVLPAGAAGKPLAARYVGPATQADPLSAGRAYLFRVPAAGLRSGMRVAVLVHDGDALDGVVVPAAAVVWYAGKAWVYEQESDSPEEFVRRQIPTAHEVGDGWFVAGRFEAGDRVVVSGAQLLLSEEFKNQITNENDD